MRDGHCIYFAYGSNLHPLRLQERIASARLIGVSELARHRLVFGKRGMDDSGKCTVIPGRRATEKVYGALFTMSASEQRVLDQFEGPDYQRLETKFRLGVETVSGFFYQAKKIKIHDYLPPYDWYRSLVLAGARFHGFPPAYVAQLARVDCIPDDDGVRVQAMQTLLARMSGF